ncbi:hypothetical protein [Mongoliitalea daihaiensis]|uniref:hypothetical protein n=1 Tax=Mongoliitalea daihaiensis TaxID=2782006 RepID=UPI001F184317|nr:hypothetical protein [Mongoliitalea daihaiensis]
MAAFVYFSTFLPIWFYKYVLLEWGWFWFFVSWLILSGVFASLVINSGTITALGGKFFFYDKIFHLACVFITSLVGYLAFNEIWIFPNSGDIGLFGKVLISLPVLFGIGFLVVLSFRWLLFGVDDI